VSHLYWHRGVYGITENERFKKDFRLCSQIQSAATSTMANIAEGFVRRSNKEFIQFLFVSISSAAEVQSHLYVAQDQRYILMNINFEKFMFMSKRCPKSFQD